MLRTLLSAIAAASVLAACSTPTETSSRPASITGCEFEYVEVCWTWVRKGNAYVHTGSDGATANMAVIKFTSTEIELERVDYGKHDNFTATYTGMVSGRTAAGTVTWNHAGNVRSGTWSAEW
jgi:ABC-type glycerol-3-phosphate transport system substrate-binding protein